MSAVIASRSCFPESEPYVQAQKSKKMFSPECFLFCRAVQPCHPKTRLGFSSSPLIYGETAAVTVAASSSDTHEAGGGVGCMTFSTPSCLFLCGGSESSTFLHILLSDFCGLI